MARCLNPRAGEGHENQPQVIRCSRCDFLVQGSHIGNYEIVSFIGAGSYGYVYEVRESAPLSRTLALKVLRLDQSTEQAQASFFQEARRIASLHHSHILPIYNFGHLPDSEQPYFVMEFAPKTILDLFRKEDNTRRLALVEELTPYIRQIADALQYVHNDGLVHQDVKPGNILIGRNGQVLLADFGTTYYLGMRTHAALQEVTGTAAYMPPEQWRGNPRRDSDQYALAVCCYELLCGRPPFAYRRQEEMWNAHFHEVPPAPQQWNPRIPVEVSAVLQRALAKDHRQRYRSITEFADQYSKAVEIAQQRYICQNCGHQNRIGAHRCSSCGLEDDQRQCFHCNQRIRFGQRCCSRCGRLTTLPHTIQHHPLLGLTIRQGRYTIKRVLKQDNNLPTMVAIASDEQNKGSYIVLKRWECTDQPLSQRAIELTHYDRVTEPLTRLRHPLMPQVKDRFAEGPYYYLAQTYLAGESLEERLLKLLRPLAETEVLGYMNSLLNILMVLEQQPQPLRHYDISPANILIDQRGRVSLTGLGVPPPPLPPRSQRGSIVKRTTRKLLISPYLPIQDKVFDQRTCIYNLAACMHHALTNIAPPHYPAYPPVRMLNPAVSTECEAILSKALIEDPAARYQNYAAIKQDVQRLLANQKH